MADRCRSCDAPIRWVVSASSGKRMPINHDPDPAGNLVLEAGGRVRSSPTPAEPDGLVRYLSHHATCPQAAEWRARNRR